MSLGFWHSVLLYGRVRAKKKKKSDMSLDAFLRLFALDLIERKPDNVLKCFKVAPQKKRIVAFAKYLFFLYA